MNVRNVNEQHRKKYFYTVLFLNDYFPKPAPPVPQSEIKVFDVIETIPEESQINIKWLDENTLWVQHGLRLPITLEMWNDQGEPIFYCPIIKTEQDSIIKLGDITIESENTLLLNFENIEKPTEDKVYKLAVRSLPAFDLTNQVYTLPPLPLDEQIDENKTGLAIIFRRHSLDSLFDLIVQFDESYWHSLEQNFDLQYLTKKSCYKNCYFAGKYTNNLNDVIELIDTTKYEIKFSWDNVKEKWCNPIYF